MPNHCHNRVTFYSANTDAVAKLKQIFTDENKFLYELLQAIKADTNYATMLSESQAAYDKLINRYNKN